MNILHIAYSLEESSAATRLAKTQENRHKTFFFLGRLSKSNYIRERQVNPYVCAVLGITLHIFEKILFKFFQIAKDEIFSFGITVALQNLMVQKIIKSNKIDVIHLHWGGYGFFPLHAASNLDIPIVITAHDYHFFTAGCHIPMACDQYNKECQMCPLTNNRLGQRVIKKIRHRNGESLKHIRPMITAPSAYTSTKISQAYPFLTIKIIGNTLGDLYGDSIVNKDIEKALYVSNRLNNDHVPTIISVGSNKSTRQNKGQDILEFILTNLHQNGIKFNYISVGKYEEYKGTLKMEHFEKISSQGLKKLYSLSDLCLVTSRFETFSQVALESILCGTPVIAFDNSGPRDIVIHGKTGFLVSAFNMNDFFQTVIVNLNFKFNNIDTFYEYARVTAHKYSQIDISREFDEVYDQALDHFDTEKIINRLS